MNFDEIINNIFSQKGLGYLIIAVIMIVVLRLLRKSGSILFWVLLVGMIFGGLSVVFPGFLESCLEFYNGGWMQ